MRADAGVRHAFRLKKCFTPNTRITPASARPGSSTRRTNVLKQIDRFRAEQNSLVIELASNDGYLLKNYVEHGIPGAGHRSVQRPGEGGGEDRRARRCTRSSRLELAKKLAAEGKRRTSIHANNVMAHVADTQRLHRRHRDDPEGYRLAGHRIAVCERTDRPLRIRHDLSRAPVLLRRDEPEESVRSPWAVHQRHRVPDHPWRIDPAIRLAKSLAKAKR